MVRPRRNEFELLFIWVREFWLPMELWKDDAGETEYIPNPREEYITPRALPRCRRASFTTSHPNFGRLVLGRSVLTKV